MSQMITDEELDRLLHDASPARTPRDAKPDAEAMAMLRRIMATDPHPHRVRNRLIGLVGAAAVVIAATVVGVSVLAPAGQAVAATPHPLAFDGSGTVRDTVSSAQSALAAVPGPDAPERFVRSATWSFNVDVDRAAARIVPQLVTLRWEADQSGEVTIVDAEAYDPSDAAANAASEVTSSGTVSMDLDMAPGDFATPVAAEPGESTDELLAVLRAFGMPDKPSAFEMVTAISSLLEQWTLTNTQQAELLGLLADTDGAVALGASTDRLGRPVTGLRVTSGDSAASDVVLISLDTGRIVGFERTNLLPDDILPEGAVIGYRLFDVDEEFVR